MESGFGVGGGAGASMVWWFSGKQSELIESFMNVIFIKLMAQKLAETDKVCFSSSIAVVVVVFADVS